MIAPDLAKELAHALAISGAIFAVARFRPDRLGVLLLAVTIAVSVYVGNPTHRVHSSGGFWHHSIVYEILNGRMPPGDPLMAGEALRYPWGPHLLAAGVGRVLRVTPPMAFAMMNVGCLVVAIFGLFRIAAVLELAPPAAVFAVTLALFGITPFNFGSLSVWLQPLLPVTMDFRATPAFAVFTTVGGASFGLMSYVLALGSVLRVLASDPRPGFGAYVALSLAIAGGLFFCPVLGVGALAGSGAAIAVSGLCGGDRHRILGAVTAIVTGLILALPYLRQIGGTGFAIDTDGRRVFDDALRYAITSAAAIAIVVWQRVAIGDLVRRSRTGATVLVTAATTTGLLYVFGDAPLGTDYGFEMLSAVTLGILLGPAFGALYERRPEVSFLLMAVILVPLTTDLLVKLDRPFWRVTDPYVENGTAIEAANPAERELYGWIRAHTTPDDVFVDSWLTVPVFAERTLYLGVNWRAPSPKLDGWRVGPRTILRDLEGRPSDRIDAREAIVYALLLDPALPDEALLTTARNDVAPGNLYVIARSPRQALKLESDTRFARVFTSARAAVYRLSRKS